MVQNEFSPKVNRVRILLGLYNGAPWLEAQLDSFAAQTHTAWDLVVSDDGSRDGGAALVARFAAAQAHHGRSVVLRDGPRAGAAANYLDALRHLPEQAEGECVALSDQDDVWLPEKLALGLEHMSAPHPVLYCSRTWVTDEDLGARVLSTYPRRAPCFANALVQNIAAGNTILLNPAARALVVAAAKRTHHEPAVHDWWIYQVVTGAGGQVVFDDAPTLLYRQHSGNAIGANMGRSSQVRRLWAAARHGQLRAWNAANLAALEPVVDMFTPRHRALFERFAALHRSTSAPARLKALWAGGFFRQGRVSTMILWGLAFFGRV